MVLGFKSHFPHSKMATVPKQRWIFFSISLSTIETVPSSHLLLPNSSLTPSWLLPCSPHGVMSVLSHLSSALPQWLSTASATEPQVMRSPCLLDTPTPRFYRHIRLNMSQNKFAFTLPVKCILLQYFLP